MSSIARTVVLSRRRAEQKVWQASQYEFEDVIAEVDDAVLLTPRRRAAGQVGRLAHGARNRLGARVGWPRRALMRPLAEAHDADLLFAVFAAPSEIGILPHARAQVDRAAAKVAYIVELWAPQVPGVADYLRQLRGFDHIFLFSRDAIPAVQDITGVPCTYLPTAVDTDLFAPTPPAPERSIDVTSYGRRLRATHEALVSAMADAGLYYHYDTVRRAFDVTSHREHRVALAATLQRSRYAVVYRNNDEPGRLPRTGGEESLTNRYFETLAAGAVMLGSAADVGDFRECFDWPDAIIEIPAPAPGVVDIITDLDRDPARLARASRAGVTQSLRRHDWAHRWQEVLASVGLEPPPGLAARLQRLEARAAAYDLAGPGDPAAPAGPGQPAEPAAPSNGRQGAALAAAVPDGEPE